MPRLRRPALVALYLVLNLAGLELVLQGYYYMTVGEWLGSRGTLPIAEPDPWGGLRVKPNLSLAHRTTEFSTLIYTNSQGFRVSSRREEYPLAKDPGRYRVLVLGPSFAFGWGVSHEQSIASQLARLLSSDPGLACRAEVINAGVPGRSFEQQVRWYQQRGRAYAPDLVVQLIYGSLIAGDARMQLLPSSSWDPPISRHAQTLLKHSASVFYAWFVVTRLRGGVAAAKGSALLKPERPGSLDPREPGIETLVRYYDKMRGSVEASGSRLLLLFVPEAYRVHPQDLPRWQHLRPVGLDREFALDRAVREHLVRRGFDCLDLTGDLVAAARAGKRLYYWLDIHWTPEGNEVAARAVARHLLDGGGCRPHRGSAAGRQDRAPAEPSAMSENAGRFRPTRLSAGVAELQGL